MSKLAFIIAIITLSGCASMSGWRALSIDSGSETALEDSVLLLNEQLPDKHREMFALAFVDIARTGVQTAVEKTPGQPYTAERFRGDLNGLTYEGVIDLADESGVRILSQYHAIRWSRAFAASDNRGFGEIPPYQEPPPFYGDDRFWPVSNPGLILSDDWKDIRP